MAMSGIKMDPTIPTFMKNMNLNKTNKYACFKLADDLQSVIIDKDILGEKAETSCKEDDKVYFEQLKAKLPADEPRYVVYDFGFVGKDNRAIKKLAFIYWCPESCPIARKMVYTSTKDTVKKCCKAETLSFQANDLSDMDYEELTSEVLKKSSG